MSGDLQDYSKYFNTLYGGDIMIITHLCHKYGKKPDMRIFAVNPQPVALVSL
jgi:hypothetical protein